MNDGFLGFGPTHWGLGLLLWLLIVVGIIAMYFAIRKKSRHGDDMGTQQVSALRDLQERYARGEINDDEFVKEKRRLEQ